MKTDMRPRPCRLTEFLSQRDCRFVETEPALDPVSGIQKDVDPAFERRDVDAPASLTEAVAAVQSRHATAARRSHHLHAHRQAVP
jgi:hypothetical protein